MCEVPMRVQWYKNLSLLLCVFQELEGEVLFVRWLVKRKERQKERKTANAVILCAFHLICVRCRTPFQMLTFKFELD